MMFNTAESVLIVEAGNTGKFSKLLYNMIGKNDDTEAGPTGPVDGSVDASIFNEDQFAQTAISSSQKVVFIGWPEGTGDYIDAIRLDNPEAIDEEGVYIGVSGNHACITVNTEPPSKETIGSFSKGQGSTAWSSTTFSRPCVPKRRRRNPKKAMIPISCLVLPKC